MSQEVVLLKIDDGITLIPKQLILSFLRREEVRTKLINLDSNIISSMNTQIYNIKSKYVELDQVVKGLAENHKNLVQINTNLNNIMSRITENWKGIHELQKHMDQLIQAAATTELQSNTINTFNYMAETIEDFLNIEQEIKNKSYYDYMVYTLSALSTVGGGNIKIATRNIWGKLCSPVLATLISWTGDNGKLCLKNLLVNQLVKDSALKLYPQGTDMEIEETTKIWFCQAADRLKCQTDQD